MTYSGLEIPSLERDLRPSVPHLLFTLSQVAILVGGPRSKLGSRIPHSVALVQGLVLMHGNHR